MKLTIISILLFFSLHINALETKFKYERIFTNNELQIPLIEELKIWGFINADLPGEIQNGRVQVQSLTVNALVTFVTNQKFDIGVEMAPTVYFSGEDLCNLHIEHIIFNFKEISSNRISSSIRKDILKALQFLDLNDPFGRRIILINLLNLQLKKQLSPYCQESFN